ncbi:MAG: hypothetical protein GYB50_04010 [Rhodobacteraceae bacterium]|nr:hypothetical protein [Paracoccaceae bacterium]
MTAIEFDTSAYVSSHGRQPKGRGSWAFATDPDADSSEAIFSPSMTYTDAKVWARAAHRASGEISDDNSTLYVLP